MTLTLLFVATALVALNVSRTASVTVICSEVAPTGSGPLPSRPQSVVGESVGVVVFCDFDPRPYRSSSTEFRVAPGDAVEALPLNVQSSVVPPLFTRQVLLPLGPETVKLAIGTVGAAVVTVRVAVAFRLPAEALIGTLLKLPPTARVFTVNVAVVWPGGNRDVRRHRDRIAARQRDDHAAGRSRRGDHERPGDRVAADDGRCAQGQPEHLRRALRNGDGGASPGCRSPPR